MMISNKHDLTPALSSPLKPLGPTEIVQQLDYILRYAFDWEDEPWIISHLLSKYKLREDYTERKIFLDDEDKIREFQDTLYLYAKNILIHWQAQHDEQEYIAAFTISISNPNLSVALLFLTYAKFIDFTCKAYPDPIKNLLSWHDPYGNTILHFAASKGDICALEILLELADETLISEKNGRGENILHHLFSSYQAQKPLSKTFEQVLSKLLSFGVDISYPNKEDKSPLTIMLQRDMLHLYHHIYHSSAKQQCLRGENYPMVFYALKFNSSNILESLILDQVPFVAPKDLCRSQPKSSLILAKSEDAYYRACEALAPNLARGVQHKAEGVVAAP